jgi:hypothetical protein
LIFPLLPNLRIVPLGMFQVLLMVVSLLIVISCAFITDVSRMKERRYSTDRFINAGCFIKDEVSAVKIRNGLLK